MEKSELLKMTKDVKTFLLEKRGEELENFRVDVIEFKLKTRFGNLNVTIYEPIRGEDLASVYTRFEEPKRAVDFGGISGKCNFHYASISNLLDNFKAFINDITRSELAKNIMFMVEEGNTYESALEKTVTEEAHKIKAQLEKELAPYKPKLDKLSKLWETQNKNNRETN